MKLKKSIVVYKGVWVDKKGGLGAIAVLEIPAGAQVRLDPRAQLGDKNRASAARCLSIESLDGLARHKSAVSSHNRKFKYVAGKPVKPDGWSKDLCDDCGHGIHFYLRRREAARWVSINYSNDPQNPEGASLDRQILSISNDRDNAANRLHQALTKLDKVKAALA